MFTVLTKNGFYRVDTLIYLPEDSTVYLIQTGSLESTAMKGFIDLDQSAVFTQILIDSDTNNNNNNNKDCFHFVSLFLGTREDKERCSRKYDGALLRHLRLEQ